MSKDSSSKPSVQKIFDSMDYGTVSEGQSLAKAWLMEHVENFGSFINGKLIGRNLEKSERISTGVNFSFSFALNKNEDYSTALSSSSSVFPKWSSLGGHARASVLYSIARQIQKHASLLSEVEALSRGVQVGNVREFDVPALIRTFYYYAGWAQIFETEFDSFKPYGPVVGVTSCSSPLTSLALFIAPALAAGNTVTLMPHVSNCMSAVLLAQLCSASGVPPGVVNVVPHDHSAPEACPAFTDSSVKKVAVIGSPIMGRSVLSASSLPRENHLMLLNRCNPMIVLDNADLDAAVDCIVDAAWVNQGQDPWSLSLLIVQESVYPTLKSKLSARIASLTVGGTFDKMADVSDSVVDSSLAKQLQEILISDPSADVVQPSGSSSSKWSPTVIFSASPPSAPVLQSCEVCPVLHVVAARSAKEAVAVANHCGGGVAASVWTESSAFAWESALQIKASTIWINSYGSLDAGVPISGRNSSGSGSFLGREGLLEYLEPVNVSTISSLEQNLSTSTSLLPSAPDAPAIDQTYKIFYGGGHKRPSSNSYRSVLDASGKVVAVIPESNRKDIRNAVEAAAKAQPGWWKRGAHNRAQIIFNLAEKLEARKRHFASALQQVYQNADLGKCLEEVEECVKLLFHYAAICDKAVQSSSQSVGNMTVVVLREPLGVIAITYCAAVGNALAGLVALIGAVIAHGNVCVVTTDIQCSSPALELAQLLEAAEVPAGVVNILSGEALTLLPTVAGHMDVNAVWCAGSVQKANAVLKEESAKSNLKLCWVQEQVLSPIKSRQMYEMRASQSKAIWLGSLASF